MAVKAVPVAIPGTPAWHSARSTGIGASEFAAIAGVHEYSTAYEVYLRKVGELPELEETLPMRRGKMLEPVIVEEAAERMGVAVKRYPVPMYRHPDHDWLFATPDAEMEDGRGLETKLTNWRVASVLGRDGTDEARLEWLCQVQIQMAVMGWEQVTIAVLLDTHSPVRLYPVERDDRTISRLIQMGGEFWDRVQNRQSPEPDFRHPSTPDLIRTLHGIASGTIIDLGPDASNDWAQRQRYMAVAKRCEERAEQHKARVLHAIGDAEVARLPDGVFELARSEVTRKSYTVKETTYTTVRERKVKR